MVRVDAQLAPARMEVESTEMKPTEVKSTEAEVVRAMADPAFYPAPPASVERRESHISRVFMTDEMAYKIKRSVTFPFLDYGTLARRRGMCEAEVSLNRRLAPDIYVGVRAIVRRGHILALGEDGEEEGAVEWAVEMRRFPEERTMKAALEAGTLGREDVARVGAALARFHRRAEVAEEATAPSRLRRIVNLDLETLGDFLEDPLQTRAYVSAERFLHAALTNLQATLLRRGAAGLVRDGHGDLRLEHVLLLDEIAVVDCVEFDPMLRRIDVGDDLSYLFMELEAAGAQELASTLIETYRQAGGDPGTEELIAFFASYRALVRAKIALLRARDAPEAGHLDEFRKMLSLAERLRWKARKPAIYVLCGGTATGKSAIAGELARRSGMSVIGSDIVRKELAGIGPLQRAPAEQYSDARNFETYAEMGRRAREALAGGRGAIVEGTFRRSRDRDRFREALDGPPEAPAHSRDAPDGAEADPLFFELRAPLAVLRERAALRISEARGPSDAKLAHVAEHQAEFEPLDEVCVASHATLRSDQPLESLADELEAHLDIRLARNNR